MMFFAGFCLGVIGGAVLMLMIFGPDVMAKNEQLDTIETDVAWIRKFAEGFSFGTQRILPGDGSKK